VAALPSFPARHATIKKNLGDSAVLTKNELSQEITKDTKEIPDFFTEANQANEGFDRGKAEP
jgi:hypothetical protein